MAHSFGKRSLAALATCHPALQKVAIRALELSPYDFTITEGYRGREAQEAAFAAGKSKAHFGSSFHNRQPSQALDFVPFPVDWEDPAKFASIALAFRLAAVEQGVTARWGGEFKSLVDLPHIEIDDPSQAQASPEDVVAALPDRAALGGLSEENLLARVVWGECRGRRADESLAIAYVVVNRAAQPRWWGTDIKSVCLAPKQFSCLNEGDPNLPKILSGDFRDGSWPTCLDAAKHAIGAFSFDPSKGATSYHAASMRVFPSWTKAMRETARVGSHIFYRGA